MKTAKFEVLLPTALQGASSPIDLSSMNGAAPIWFQFGGTFNASYKPEISTDDGTTWVDATKLFFDQAAQTALAADVSTDASVMTKQNLPLLRFRCTAFVSASATDVPRVMVKGQDSRSV